MGQQVVFPMTPIRIPQAGSTRRPALITSCCQQEEVRSLISRTDAMSKSQLLTLPGLEEEEAAEQKDHERRGDIVCPTSI